MSGKRYKDLTNKTCNTSKAKKLGKSVKETRVEEEEKRKRLSATFKGKIGI